MCDASDGIFPPELVALFLWEEVPEAIMELRGGDLDGRVIIEWVTHNSETSFYRAEWESGGVSWLDRGDSHARCSQLSLSEDLNEQIPEAMSDEDRRCREPK